MSSPFDHLKEDHRPPKNGWADGGYINTCLSCGCGFVGDKRAYQCADCAYKEPKQMNLTELSKTVHAANEKWWQDPATGQRLKRNRGELLALIHSEISEALEGERKNLKDDKLPQYPMAAVEIVDAIIRSLDYLAGIHPDIDVQEVFDAKMAYNANREDHKHEARLIAGGKQF